jgi:transcriptional regulator with XRE-family HTH domain
MKNRIKKFRTNKNLTMQALAEKTGTTASQINKLEKGERRLTADWMYRLAEALDIAPSDLFPKMDTEDKINTTSSSKSEADKSSTHMNVGDISSTNEGHDWQIPKSAFQNKKDIAPQIVQIHQKDLEPELCDGDYVVIDTKDCRPTQPGIFVTKNNQDEYLIQFCKLIFKDGEEQVQITHVEKTEDGIKKSKIIKHIEDANIQGRIVAHWHWM